MFHPFDTVDIMTSIRFNCAKVVAVYARSYPPNVADLTQDTRFVKEALTLLEIEQRELELAAYLETEPEITLPEAVETEVGELELATHLKTEPDLNMRSRSRSRRSRSRSRRSRSRSPSHEEGWRRSRSRSRRSRSRSPSHEEHEPQGVESTEIEDLESCPPFILTR